jgi:DNA-binding MarR family transcriptional regulator
VWQQRKVSGLQSTRAEHEPKEPHGISALAVLSRIQAEFDVDINEIRMLEFIAKKESPPVQIEIAQHCGVSPMTASNMIQRLFLKGMVERIEHPEDRRKNFVKLLPLGRRVVDSVNG